MEFDVIARYFTWQDLPSLAAQDLAGPSPQLGDDACLLPALIDDNKCWVVSTDTLVAGVHFNEYFTPADIAAKALAVNISDLAAMGARSAYFLLNLTSPDFDEAFLQEFSTSLATQGQHYKIKLVGGDCTRGPLSITITVFGVAFKKTALRRNAAQENDIIAVTGSLGGAVYALHNFTQATAQDREHFLLRPKIPINFAYAVSECGIAHAGIDISDGLLQDLGHICQQSVCGAKLTIAELPLAHSEVIPQQALTGGDDYQLLCTVPQDKWLAALELAKQHDVLLHKIGTITTQQEVILDYGSHQEQLTVAAALASGWQHV